MSKSWKIWPRGQQQEYASVRPSADSTEDEEAPFVRDSIVEKSRFLPFAAPQQSRLNLFAVFPWVLSLVLSLVSLFLVLNNKPDLCHLPNSFDRGWITDFGQYLPYLPTLPQYSSPYIPFPLPGDLYSD